MICREPSLDRALRPFPKDTSFKWVNDYMDTLRPQCQADIANINSALGAQSSELVV